MKPNNAFLTQAVPADHREAFEQALRQALGTSQPALRKQALEEVSRHLVHPRLILESPLLADNHIWRREAVLVADAFESVTNGMENPGALEDLDNLEPGSFFQPWRHLILAIHFFYEHLDEGVSAHLAQIPSSSPLQVLASALGPLAGQAQTTPLTPSQRRLTDQIVRPDERVLPWVQDIAEGLESDQEGLFWEALTEWLEEVAPSYPDQAKSAVLWAWNQLEWRDFDEAVLLELAASLWGRTESYRLAALGTSPWDGEGAALLWLRFMVSALRENCLGEMGLRRALVHAEQLHQAVTLGSEATEEWHETWSTLVRTWNQETQALGWSGLSLEDNPGTHCLPAPKPISHDGQLDLFA